VSALVKLVVENGKRDFRKELRPSAENGSDEGKARNHGKKTDLPSLREMDPDEIIPMDNAKFRDF
jgi:hypothetical protein